jgi:hypothetical protein
LEILNSRLFNFEIPTKFGLTLHRLTLDTGIVEYLRLTRSGTEVQVDVARIMELVRADWEVPLLGALTAAEVEEAEVPTGGTPGCTISVHQDHMTSPHQAPTILEEPPTCTAVVC